MYRICTQRRQTINLTFYNQIIRIIDEKTTDKAKILHTLLAEMSTIMLLIFSADHRENLNCQEVTEAEELNVFHCFNMFYSDQTI